MKFDKNSLWRNPIVGFAGDWHGNGKWAAHAIQLVSTARKVDVIYQLGDFGLWHGERGERYLTQVGDALERYNTMLVVTPGNHENYKILNSYPTNDEGFLVNPEHERIWFAPRGHVWTHGHVRFGSLGGAGSIDRLMRVEGDSWWPEEEITEEDVKSLAKSMDSAGFSELDVLLTHDIPAGVTMPNEMRASWITPDITHYCYKQRVLLREAADLAKPSWILHGHWHRAVTNTLEGVDFRGEEYTAKIIGLDKEGPKNMTTAHLTPILGLTELKKL